MEPGFNERRGEIGIGHALKSMLLKDEIVNRVANSKLVTFNLEDYYPKGERIAFDISQWLYEGIILREKDFREQLKTHDWSRYKDAYVALDCSTSAIIPAWAFMLVSLELANFAKKVVVGSLDTLESILFAELLERLNLDEFKDSSLIIKGCSNQPIPQNAYVLLAQKLQPIAKSIMYGEACSSVPLFKKGKPSIN